LNFDQLHAMTASNMSDVLGKRHKEYDDNHDSVKLETAIHDVAGQLQQLTEAVTKQQQQLQELSGQQAALATQIAEYHTQASGLAATAKAVRGECGRVRAYAELTDNRVRLVDEDLGDFRESGCIRILAEKNSLLWASAQAVIVWQP
jgi:chromosome segregation ATPase